MGHVPANHISRRITVSAPSPILAEGFPHFRTFYIKRWAPETQILTPLKGLSGENYAMV
jgi:hypothetical protein